MHACMYIGMSKKYFAPRREHGLPIGLVLSVDLSKKKARRNKKRLICSTAEATF
jgi:hypothetical protein